MIPKEKAKELIDRFQNIDTVVYGCSDEFGKNPCVVSNAMLIKSAKQCALICVDEILESYNPLEYYPENLRDYWQEVKQEINKTWT